MIQKKTKEEISIMREGGAKLGTILDALLAMASPGISLADIEREADRRIAGSGGTPSFKTVKGYKWATCLCVNEVVVHGIPTAYVLKDGDVLTIDIGLLYGRFHTDTAWTKIVGNDSSPQASKKEQFLSTGRQALEDAISLARIGNYVGDLSAAIQKQIEGQKYSIVKSLVGHGVGRELHEDPQIPNFLRGNSRNSYRFSGGETIAIEPIYAMGQGLIVYENSDGWTLATRDRSLTAVFEHSIAITEEGPIVLTKAAG